MNARELHRFLESGREFATWIKQRITKYEFEENVDYVSLSQNVKRDTGSSVRREYHISIDMAKELSMVENNEKGREARKYFIEMEKQVLSNKVPQTYAQALLEAGRLALENEALHLENVNQKKEIEHKGEIITGFTDNLDVFAKVDIINRVVKRGGNVRERYVELYKSFREVHHIDIPARCKGYNAKMEKKKDALSGIRYAEKYGMVDNLYEVAVKLYETEINAILEELTVINED